MRVYKCVIGRQTSVVIFFSIRSAPFDFTAGVWFFNIKRLNAAAKKGFQNNFCVDALRIPSEW